MSSQKVKLINFINLNYQDTATVLEWRNHDNVKKWMYNSRVISKEKHLKFFQILKTSIDKKYFLVLQNDQSIGVIYFTNINSITKTSEIGIYSNPKLKGMGKVLLSNICEYGFDTLKLNKLIAEVFAENEKAINLYRSFNFQDFPNKSTLQHNIIHMELKNENRQL